MLECKPLKEDSDYLIYNDGRLFSKKTNRFLKGKVDNVGYQCYALNFKGSNIRNSKMLYAHRLVAEYFIDNPNNLPVVNHKDENRLNNNVENLEWVDFKENTRQYLENNNIERKKPKYFKKDLPGEEWLDIKDYPNYEVSNLGRIRNKKTNRLLHFDQPYKYARVCLRQDKKRQRNLMVHRLVYCTFHDDYDLDGFVIDHIDADTANNRLDNLQKITQRENNLKQKRFQK